MKAEIKVPAVGESITEATIAEWVKKSGEYVQRDDILLVLETDKASVEVVAEQSGVLTTKADEGDTVNVGAVLGEIDTEAAAPAGSPEPSQAAAPTATTPAGAEPPLSPAVRKIVAEENLQPANIAGTGKDGRITKADAMAAAQAFPTTPTTPPPMTESAQPAATLPPLPIASSASASEEERREPMSQLRKTIAKRLVEAQHTAAILTTFNEVDMTNILELRKKYKDGFKEKYGVSLGFMGFFVKATIEALKEFPRVNASIDGTDFVLKNYYNIGIAVSTPKGLVVPVIRQADQLSLAEIELAIRHYAIKARDGKISVDDLSGGTFTISNGGVFGSLLSTPILNPPQSGILGLHKLEERPVAVNGQVEIRSMMYTALSYDHRIIDGKESVSFLVRIKECIEDPSRIFLGI